MSIFDPPEMFPANQAAAYIGVKPQTLAAWRCHRSQNLPFIKVGRLIKYRREDLDAFLAANTVGAVSK